MSSLSSHFEGCLLGAMIGDSLGSQVENVPVSVMTHRYPAADSLLALQPGSYGSTTEMTVALAESLAAAPEFDGADFAARLASRWHEARGYGQGTTIALTRLKAGTPWQEAGAAHAGRGCYGNAAAARSAPVGLMFYDDIPMLRWVAEEAAGITHTHALGVEGAVVFALGVAHAFLTRKDGIGAQDLFERIAADVQVREYRTHLEMAASLARTPPAPSVVVDRLGNNQTALGSVVTALLCFATNTLSFADAAAAALHLGGNTSAITAMTLALSGAHLGADGIPPRWIEGLEKSEISPLAMGELARKLFAAR
jgi:poly(ADP-ribose) glycohydrolase ARH3